MQLTLRHPWLAALAAVGYLLGYLLVFAHFAVEQHGVCLEHDGAHHVEDAGDPTDRPVEAGIAALPSAVDDHCHLLNAVRIFVRDETRPMVAALLPLATSDFETAVSPRGPPPTGAIWRYAPKQSPPQAS